MTSSAAPALRQRVGNGNHAGILQLQRTLGNRQTAALLHSQTNSPKLHGTNAYGAALHDANSARAARTNQLLRTLGRSLELDPRHLAVHTDTEAARVTARTSHGAANAQRIMLDPARYDARSLRSRELLAHEAAHVAQARNAEVAGVDRSRAAWLAEVEAGSIARDFAAGRRVEKPLLWRPEGEWTGFSLPDLASMEELTRIKLAIASSVRSRVGNRPLAGFIVRSMTRWAGGDLEGLAQEQSALAVDAAAPGQATTAREDNVDQTASSPRRSRREMRRNDPEAFRALREWERSTMQEQRGLERSIRGEFQSDREARRRADGRARVNGTDVVLALMRAMTGVGAEVLHAGPIFPLQLGIRWSGLELDAVADARLRGIELSGAIQTSFLGLPVRIGDTAPLPMGARDRPALRRARQATLHFPWLSLDVYGTLPGAEMGLFASGPGYITPSHLSYEWLRFTLPRGSLGIPGLAPGLLDVLDWGGEPPQVLVTDFDLRRGSGVHCGDIRFAQGPVDVSAFGGLFAVQGLDVSGGEITEDGALTLSLKATRVIVLRGFAAAGPYSIAYSSREGLTVTFGRADFGPFSVESGQLGPGMQARLIGAQIDPPSRLLGPIRLREIIIGSDGSLRVEALSPPTLKAWVEQKLATALGPMLARVDGAAKARAPTGPSTAEDMSRTETSPDDTATRVQPEPPREHIEPTRARPRLHLPTVHLPSLRLRRDRAVEAPTETLEEKQAQTIHVVKPGETLSLIARQYYGDLTRFGEIAEANGIAPPAYTIEVGQQLIIPRVEVAHTGVPQAAVTPATSAAPVAAAPAPEQAAASEHAPPFIAALRKLRDTHRSRRQEHRTHKADTTPAVQEVAAEAPEQTSEQAVPAVERDNYVISSSKALIRDENGKALPDGSVIARWTAVTVLETKSLQPQGAKTALVLARVRYQSDRGTMECWTSMSNLYAQFWVPEEHRAEYEQIDLGYAEALLRLNPTATRAALVDSGPGVLEVIDRFYPNSHSLSDLSSTFRPKMSNFLNFVAANGIGFSIGATLRHPLRSLVFDSAMDAATGRDGLMEAQAQCIRYGVPINWLHYKTDGSLDVQYSMQMAENVKVQFDISKRANRGIHDELGGKTSQHNLGNAVDVTFNFSFTEKTIQKGDKEYKINAKNETPIDTVDRKGNPIKLLANVENKPLTKLGWEQFGVIRTMDDDAVHWSETGA